MNQYLPKLQPYPFEKLAKLFESVTPADKPPIKLSIGEPKHEPPTFVLDELKNNLDKVAVYPSTGGLPELRQSIADWAEKRFRLESGALDKDQNILPVNGTREAIFAFTQAVVDASKPNALVLSPNPFYQIYEGATFLSGAELKLLPCLADKNFVPDFDLVDEETWQNCQILFLCSPGNPTGAVISFDTIQKLIALSDKHDFIIASDECYSEIYINEDEPPIGLLEACGRLQRHDFKNIIVFHSLSKRSNLPGLRSGFVAGDASIIKPFLRYRTYHGCAMPIQTQLASIAAWGDEAHVVENRSAYKLKFEKVLEILEPVMNISQTDASFYLWPETPIDDEQFAAQLLAQQNVVVVPGSYLSRDVDGNNPGSNRIRMALVAPVEECIEAAERIREFVLSLR